MSQDTSNRSTQQQQAPEWRPYVPAAGETVWADNPRNRRTPDAPVSRDYDPEALPEGWFPDWRPMRSAWQAAVRLYAPHGVDLEVTALEMVSWAKGKELPPTDDLWMKFLKHERDRLTDIERRREERDRPKDTRTTYGRVYNVAD